MSENQEQKAIKRFTVLEFLAVVFNATLAVVAVAGLIYLHRQTTATEGQTTLLKKQYDDAKAGEERFRTERDTALTAAKSQADSTGNSSRRTRPWPKPRKPTPVP